MNFDEKAKEFDTARRKKRATIIAGCIRDSVLDLHLTAMEFGCGTGLVGMELISSFSSLVFVDSSKNMVDEVNEKISLIPNAEAICMDLTKDIITEKTFDCIFTSMVLHHIENTNQILSVLFDLLNKEGRIIIVDLDKENGQFHAEEPDFKGHNGFEQPHMFSLLMEAGFHNIRVDSFYYSSKEINGCLIPYSLFIAVADKI